MNNAESRTLLVTGASSGIGLAVSKRLLALGHEVIGLGRTMDQHIDLGDAAGFHPANIDLADLKALPGRLQALAKQFPQITGIICCAGRGQFGSLEEFSFDQIDALMDLNFTSQAYVTRALLPLLKRQKRGDLIYIGSEAALSGGRRGAIYCASKFALRGMAQALREECARSGVRVCIINPGMVKTPFFEELNFAPGDHEHNYVEPEDIADAVAMVVEARPGTVFDEINLSPLKKVLQFKQDGDTR